MIGLWVSREISKLHMGQLSFIHEGITFTLSLPCLGNYKQDRRETMLLSRLSDYKSSNMRDSEISMRLASNITKFQNLSNQGEVTSQTVRILMADDSPLNRKMLSSIIINAMKELNQVYDITEVSDGVEAVERVKKSYEVHDPYHVIFMDNTMLSMNGPEASKQIRELGYQGFIIGVTGNVLSKDIEQFMNYGANRVLKKPVSRSVIHSILVSVLQSLSEPICNDV